MDDDLLEHIQINELSPIQQSRYIRKLSERGKTGEEIAERFGRSTAWVSNRKRLSELPEHVQEMVHEKQISVRQALALEKAFRVKKGSPEKLISTDINIDKLIDGAKEGELTSSQIRQRVRGLESDERSTVFYLVRLSGGLKFGITESPKERFSDYQKVESLRQKSCASRELASEAERRMKQIKNLLGLGTSKGSETMMDSDFAIKVFDRFLENSPFFQ